MIKNETDGEGVDKDYNMARNKTGSKEEKKTKYTRDPHSRYTEINKS